MKKAIIIRHSVAIIEIEEIEAKIMAKMSAVMKSAATMRASA
jgi:hypothetical protein